jgi:hypothetical protein
LQKVWRGIWRHGENPAGEGDGHCWGRMLKFWTAHNQFVSWSVRISSTFWHPVHIYE